MAICRIDLDKHYGRKEFGERDRIAGAIIRALNTQGLRYIGYKSNPCSPDPRDSAENMAKRKKEGKWSLLQTIEFPGQPYYNRTFFHFGKGCYIEHFGLFSDDLRDPKKERGSYFVSIEYDDRLEWDRERARDIEKKLNELGFSSDFKDYEVIDYQI